MGTEIRELLRLMYNEMACKCLWNHSGFVAEVRNAVANGGDDATLRDLLRKAWRKSWWWMPELECRVKAAMR